MEVNKQDFDESDPKIQAMIKAAGEEAKQNLIFLDKGMGFCHVVWEEQKRILKQKYNINWKTPQEMNPYVMWD